jgi:hypothetical protein
VHWYRFLSDCFDLSLQYHSPFLSRLDRTSGPRPHFWFHDHIPLDTPHSVGLLCTSDQPDTETSIPNNTRNSQETDIYASSGIRTRNPSKRTAVDSSLRPRGHRDQQYHSTSASYSFIHSFIHSFVRFFIHPSRTIY